MQVNKYGPNFVAEGATSSQPRPTAIKDTLKAFVDPHKAEIKAAEEKLATLDADSPEAVQLQAFVDSFITDLSRISAEPGRDLLLQAETKEFWEADAGHALTAVKNATLWVIGYGYGTHRPMDAFLTDMPADKKLTFNVISTPSSHAGSTDDEMEKNFELFANTNVYNIEVYHEAADGTRTLLQQLSHKVENPPEYASLSPDITVDLSTLSGGKLIIEGSPEGSAGVEGYVEARRTVIHL